MNLTKSLKKKLTILFVLAFSSAPYLSLAQNMFYHLLGSSVSAYTWVGLGGDALWTTSANWAAGVVPSTNDTPIFDTNCVSNCSPTINTSIDIAGLQIKTGYSGTITQSAGSTITVGANGWSQAAGTFVPSSDDITIGKAFLLTGGTFTSTSGILKLSKNASAEGEPTNDVVFNVGASATFVHNGGTVILYELSNTNNSYNHVIEVPSGLTLNHLILNAEGTGTGTTNWKISTGQTVTVEGDLTMGRVAGNNKVSLGTGTLNLGGDLTISAGSNGSTATVVMNNTTAQTYTYSGTAPADRGPQLKINKASGSVTAAGGSTDLALTSLDLTSGSFTAPTGTLTLARDTVFDGLLDNDTVLNVSTGTTFTHSNGLVRFYELSGSNSSYTHNITIPSGLDLYDVTMNAAGTGSGTTTWKISSGQTLKVLNDFIIGRSSGTNNTAVSTGSVEVIGNATFDAGANGGDAHFLYKNTLAKNITIDASAVTPTGNVTFNGTGAGYNISGTMTVTGGLIIGNATSSSAYLDGGTISALGSVTFNNNGYSGTTNVKVAGSSNQTVSAVSGAVIPSFEIASTGGTVSLSGTLEFKGHFINTSGTVLTVSNPVNVALASAGSTVTASSTNGAGQPTSAINNGSRTGAVWDSGGGWLDGTNNVFPDWVEINFNASKTIDRIIVYSIQNNYASPIEPTDALTGSSYVLTQFDLQYWDGASWQSIPGASASGNNLIKRSFTFAPVTTSKIKINITGTADGRSRIAEIEAFQEADFVGNVIFSGTNSTITPGSIVFQDVTFSGANSTYTLNGTMTVNGTLAMGDTGTGVLNTGTVSANGSINFVNNGLSGTGTVRAAGTSSQTVTGVSSASIPNFQVISTGGTVTFSGYLLFSKNYTYTSGTVVTTGTTMHFTATSSTNTITPGAVVYNADVLFQGNTATFTLTGTFTVTGTLTLGDNVGSGQINTGTFAAQNNVVINQFGYGGTGVLTFTGANATTLDIAGTAARMTGAVTVNKTLPGSVTLSTNAPFNGASQSFNLTSGTIDLNGNTLSITSGLTIALAGTLICNGGTYTSGSLNNSGTIDCSGFGFNWTGNGGNTDWNTAGNWSNNAVPGVNDVATFSDTYCGSNCNATINVNPNVRGLRLLGNYTGTLTQGAGVAATFGTSGVIQSGGTFTGSDATLTFSGPIVLNAGTFTSTSGTLAAPSSWTVTGSPTFNANSGTVSFNSSGSSQTITPGSINFNNVSFQAWAYTYTIVGTMNVNGNLLLANTHTSSGTLSGGAIEVSGNITGASYGYVGSTVVRLVGSTDQTVTSIAGAYLPTFEVASTGGTVFLSGYLNFRNNYTYTSGTIDAGTSDVAFSAGGSQTATLGPGPYNNLLFVGWAYTITLSGTTVVNGTLTLGNTHSSSGTLTGGTIEAMGNVITSSYGYVGTTLIKIAGSSNQTITGVANGRIPNFEIASTGGVVTLSGTLRFTRNYTYTSGTVDASASIFHYNPGNYAVTFVPGPISYNDVSINGYASTYNMTGTLDVYGLLTLADTWNGYNAPINTGTIRAYGDVTFSSYGATGSGLLKIMGSGNQTLTGVSTANIPHMEIASTGGTVTYSGTLRVWGNYTYTSGTLDTGTSTMWFVGNKSITFGAYDYYDVTFIGSTATYTLTDTVTVNGVLTLDCSSSGGSIINGGTILFKGALSAVNFGVYGSTLIKAVGSSSQTLTGVSGARIPNFEIDSTGGTVSFSGNLKFVGNYTYTAGTVNAGASTIQLSTGITFNHGGINYHHVQFNSGAVGTYTMAGTLYVGGDLTMHSGSSSGNTINGGQIQVSGNTYFTSFGFKGTTQLAFVGASSSVLNIASGAFRTAGNITVNKTGGSALTLQTAALFNTAGQTMSITSGSINMAGYAMTVASTLTLAAGTSITKSSGVLTANGSPVASGGYSGGTINP